MSTSAPCPLCGAGSFSLLSLDDRFDPVSTHEIRRCRCCGIRFTHPPGSSDSPAGYEPHVLSRSREREGGTRGRILRIFYRGEGTLLDRALLFLPGLLFRVRDHLKVLARDLYARPFRRRGNLLDVGSGAGNALALWRDQQASCIGVEPDRGAAEIARSVLGLDVRPGRLEEHPFPDASFDVLTLCHVLEHVDDPRALLARAARLLKPGGEILVWTPDVEYPLRPFFGPAWFPYEVPRHRWHFGRRDVARLLREAGLRPVDVQPDWRDTSLRTSARALGGIPGRILKRRTVRILLSLAARWIRRGEAMRIRAVKPGEP